MDRNALLLQHVDRDGLGIEVGPSHRPVAPKREGYRVHIIDHADREALVAKYREHGVDTAAIEEVDFVSHGEDYATLTQARGRYDWIIASHVIEHTPDLIGFLQGCEAVLKDDGVLSLAVPDKRYCFDRYRPVTGLARIVDSHVARATIHSAGSVAEYFCNVAIDEGRPAWGPDREPRLQLAHTLDDARRGMASVLQEQAYLDVHAWCFVPHSFRLLMRDLHDLGFIGLREVAFVESRSHEFFMTLGKAGAGNETPRLDWLHRIDTELLPEALALPPVTAPAEPPPVEIRSEIPPRRWTGFPGWPRRR